MNIGITGLVVPEAWTFEETLENIKNAGYNSFELALRDTGYFSLASSDSELKKIAEQADSAGVDLVSICPAVRSRPKDLMNADSSVRDESLDTFCEYIRIAECVGVDTILIVLGSLAPELYYDTAYKNALRSMKTLAPIAEAAGVKLAIEYVWNKFLLSPMEFAQFCDDVGSPNVGFYFDPGNMAIFSYPEHWVRICGRHLMAVHMKDFRREGSVWTPLLDGDVDFNRVMFELRSLGFDGPLVSEVDSATASFTDTAKTIREIIDA
jgi:L-ribulose-5-phosphate 3-epimerase